MVSRARFELTTLWLKVKCSTSWANGTNNIKMAASARFELAKCQSQSLMPYHLATRQNTGGERWIRTTEPEGTDLQSAAFGHFAIPPNQFNKWLNIINGAGNRTWTHNLLITSQLLYQLSYSGTWWAIQDSNLWPPACKAGALTNWANRPNLNWFVSTIFPRWQVQYYH